MTDTFVYGATVRFSVEFKNSLGAFADPTTVTLKTEDPTGTEATYADATQDATGKYHRDVQVSVPGGWVWRWIATGAVAQVDEGEFDVLTSRFA